MHDIEGIGRAVFAEACLDPFARPVPEAAFEITRRLFGYDAVRQAPMRADSSAVEVKGRPFIYYRAGMSRPRGNFAVAQVLARMFLEQRGVMTTEEDEALAAWITAPTPTMHAAMSRVGIDVLALATCFSIPQTSAAIRTLDVGHFDGAVTTPHRVHKRGLLEHVGDERVRAMADGRPSTMKRVVLKDELGSRVALLPKTKKTSGSTDGAIVIPFDRARRRSA